MTEDFTNDSPSKRFARFMFWSSVASAEQGEVFRNGRYLVRATKDAGDVRVLMGMGIPPKNILAVSRDAAIALSVKERFPHVKVAVGDPSNVSKEFRRKLTAAYLDLGDAVTESMIDDMVQTIKHGLRDQGVLGVTFIVGQEGEVDVRFREELEIAEGTQYDFMSDLEFLRMYIRLEKGTVKRFGNDTIKRLENIISDPEENAEAIKQAADVFRKAHIGSPRGELGVMARVSFLGNRLCEALYPARTFVMTGAAFIYTEGDRTKGIALFRTRRYSGMTEKKFTWKAMNYATDLGFTAVHDCTRSADGLRLEVLDWFRHVAKDEKKPLTPALEANCVENTAAFFNLHTETVLAWRMGQKLEETAT